MITIISGTNRPSSNTLKVAEIYKQILAEKDIESKILSLETVNVLSYDDDFVKIEVEYIIPAQYFIFITPEYNGSFPGILKLFIDNSQARKIWSNKKALLTGVAAGRAGNLRGMDHLADVLNHLNITIHPDKLPISSIDRLMDSTGAIIDPITRKSIRHQLDRFLEWAGLTVSLLSNN